jgi:TP901 family phage tail tape measure protein
MADRVVSYVFKGSFTNLTGGLAAAGKSTKDFGDKLTALDKNGAKTRAGLTSIGNTAGKIGLVAAAGLGAIVVATANFDKAMSAVQAATHETAGAMEDLRAAALKAGADTAFSASEAAAGIENLAKAGVATRDILAGGLTGALDLAAAGQLEVADAAEIAATALTQFKLEGKDIPHVADLLAAAAGKAQGSVQDMGYALKYAGVPANALGISIEETTGVIAEFASAGIIGEQAGTNLRSIMLSLAAPTKIATKEMEKYGLQLYDSSGQFIGLGAAAEQLQANLRNATEAERNHALSVIFGQESIQGAITLYQGGGSAVDEWTDKVNDSGYAAETAAIQMDNLSGDIEALKGSLETALIGAGGSSQGPLRELVQGLTDTVNAFSDLPGPMKTATTAGLGLTAGLAGLVFISSKVVSGMASAQLSMVNMGMSAERAAKTTRILSRTMGAAAGVGVFALGMSNANQALGSFEAAAGGAMAGFAVGGPWGAAIGGAVGLFASLATNAEDASGAVDSFTDALDTQTGALTENNRMLAQKALQDSGAFDAAERLGLNLALVTDAALGNADAIAAVTDATEEWQFAADRLRAGGTSDHDKEGLALIKLQDEIGATNDVVEQSSEKWKQNKEAASGAAGAADDVAGATSALGGVQKQSVKLTAAQTEALKKSRDAASDTAHEFFGLGDSVDKAKVSLGTWLKDLEKQADALRNFRINAEKAAKKGLRQGLIAALEEAGPAGALRMKQLANATDAEIKRANRAWKRGQDEIKKYTNAIGGVQPKVDTKVNLNTDEALSKLNYFASLFKGLNGDTVTTHVKTIADRPTIHKATGGPVFGPGSETSDSIPAMLSTNEHVWSAREVRAAGGHAALERMRMKARTGQLPHFRDGGAVGHYDAPRFRDGGYVRHSDVTSSRAGATSMVVTGTLQTPWGPAHIEGIARDVARQEIDADASYQAGLERMNG